MLLRFSFRASWCWNIRYGKKFPIHLLGKNWKQEAIKQGKKYAKQKLAEHGYDGPISNTLLDAGADYASQKAIGGSMMVGGPKSLPAFLRKKAEASVLGVSQVPIEPNYVGGKLVRGSQEAKRPKDKNGKVTSNA